MFKKRLLSFAWRLGAYIIVAALAWIASPEHLAILELDPGVIAVIALILGEVTKFVNNLLSKKDPV